VIPLALLEALVCPLSKISFPHKNTYKRINIYLIKMGGKRDETAEERSKRKEKEKREGASKKKDKKRDETPEERAARKATAKSSSADGKSKDERKEKSAKASKQSQSGQAALKEKKQKSRDLPVGMMMHEKGGSKTIT